MGSTPSEPRRRDARFLTWLWSLALGSRLVWVLLVHPPKDHRFSDMKFYWWRAERVADRGLWGAPDPIMAWQAWGTHAVLSLPIRLFGSAAPVVAGVVWALAGAAIVGGVYALAREVVPRRYAKAAGVAALLWFPHLSLTGFFTSEVPYTAAMVWLSVDLARILRGRSFKLPRLLSTLGLAIVVRPQALVFVAVFVAGALALPAIRRTVTLRVLGIVVGWTALIAAICVVRFHHHSEGQLGIAQNASLNYAAGRCHMVEVTAPASGAEVAHFADHGRTITTRKVSLPGFRSLHQRIEPEHPLALRPVRGETIALAHPFGQREQLRELAKACSRQTGVAGQVRHAAVHVSLLWTYAHPWPEVSDGEAARPLFVIAELFRALSASVILPFAMLGAYRLRRHPTALVLLGQTGAGLAVAAVFFGSPRLRTPLDPVLLVLAIEGLRRVWVGVAGWQSKRRTTA